jgi:hypothetical protein
VRGHEDAIDIRGRARHPGLKEMMHGGVILARQPLTHPRHHIVEIEALGLGQLRLIGVVLVRLVLAPGPGDGELILAILPGERADLAPILALIAFDNHGLLQGSGFQIVLMPADQMPT